MKTTISATARDQEITMRALIVSVAVAVALFSAPVIATAQTGNFCLTDTNSGATNCIYQTMAQCEQAKGTSHEAKCMSRAQSTGTGAAGSMDKPSGGTTGTPTR